MNDDIHVNIHVSTMDRDYILSPVAARKIRESLMLAIRFASTYLDDEVETPLHPSASWRYD